MIEIKKPLKKIISVYFIVKLRTTFFRFKLLVQKDVIAFFYQSMLRRRKLNM